MFRDDSPDRVNGRRRHRHPVSTKVDDPDYQRALKAVEDAYEDRSALTPSERLRLMFHRDEEGGFSPEMQFVSQATGLSLFFGAVTGGFNYGRREFVQFMADNKQTMFG